MTRWLAPCAAIGILAGCGSPAIPTAAALSPSTLLHLDAGTSGGLSDDLAAHPSVQLARPGAFAMTGAAAPFLQALDAVVVPQRERLAARLRADAEVVGGLASWARLSDTGRLAVLQRVMGITCEVMGCRRPALTTQARDPDEPGLFAAYLARKPVGEVVLYMAPLTTAGASVAVSAIVHELRHAAQDQLAEGAAGLAAGSPEGVLARAYGEAFEVVNDRGGEDGLAYGDYVHLNIEFDAFQTGNQVAAAVSSGSDASAQLGFVDVKYGRNLAPVFDLRAAAQTTPGVALFTAVNRSQFEALRTAAPGGRGQERLRFPGGGRRRYQAIGREPLPHGRGTDGAGHLDTAKLRQAPRAR